MKCVGNEVSTGSDSDRVNRMLLDPSIKLRAGRYRSRY
jgi:hypothetical protein